MTRDQERRLAHALIQAAGDLVEGEAENPAGIDPAEAFQQLAQWLKGLPVDALLSYLIAPAEGWPS